MMKILLKILVAPFALALSLLTALLVFLFDICAFLLSPYGLQAAAGSLLWALDGGKSALYLFLAS